MTQIYESIGGEYVAVLSGEYTISQLEDIIWAMNQQDYLDHTCPLCFVGNNFGHKEGCPNAE